MSGNWTQIEQELARRIQSGKYLSALKASRYAGDPLLARVTPDLQASVRLARESVTAARGGIEEAGTIHNLEIVDLEGRTALYRGADFMTKGSDAGRWWFDDRALRGALLEASAHGKDEASRMLIFSYCLRKRLAVQFNFSRLNDWFCLAPPPKIPLPAIRGEGQPKQMYPKESFELEKLHRMGINPTLPGQVLQYFLPIVPTVYVHPYRLDFQYLH